MNTAMTGSIPRAFGFAILIAMSTNNNNEQSEQREAFLDAMERRGYGQRDGQQDRSGVSLDVLKAEYDLDTLNKDTEVEAEIDSLQRRITLLESRTPEHVETLQAKKEALEHLKGGRRFRSWGSVRRKLEDFQ